MIRMPPLQRLFRAGLLALLSFATIQAQASGPELIDRIVAVVNDGVVLQSELTEEMRAVRAQIAQRNINPPPEDELRRQVLERLVVQRLQLDLARQQGITVDEATLDAAVRRVAENNNLSLTQFRDALINEGMSMAGFRERLREEITLNRLHQQEMQRRIDVTPQEVAQFLERTSPTDAEYRLSHILVSVPEAARQDEIREAEQRARSIRERLDDGADFASVAAATSDSQTALDGGDLGWRGAGEIPSVLADDIDNLDVGDVSRVLRSPSGFHIFRLADRRSGEPRMITQTRARHILIETNEVVTDRDARRRLEGLRERLEGGDSFEELARANSDDTASARRGGDLGWINPGSMVPAFEQAMNRLRPGELSRPFQSRFGWHVVEVMERREQDATEEIRRAEASRQLRERKEEEEMQIWLRELRDEAYVDYRLEA